MSFGGSSALVDTSRHGRTPTRRVGLPCSFGRRLPANHLPSYWVCRHKVSCRLLVTTPCRPQWQRGKSGRNLHVVREANF